MATIRFLRRTHLLTTTLRPILCHLHHFSTTPNPDPQPNRSHPKSRMLTPLETQFETWITRLQPGFTPCDVNQALKSQTDADLAHDIFRWTAQQRGYKHDHTTYLTMIQLSLSSRRHRIAETLLDEILAGTVPPTLPLYNSLIRFCCSHRCLFNRAFDVYKRMMHHKCVPDLDTYTMLFTVLLKKFTKLNVSYVYLNSVRSLRKQMKLFGVVPDVYVLNLIIKAYAKCLEVDEAVRVFREMGLYGCEPNKYSYSYLVKGFCEKGRVFEGLKLFREMREKGLVGTSSAWMVLVCSLALERQFVVAVEVLRDMIGNEMSPDMLTYRTLFDEMCRDGKGNDAVELLEEFRGKDLKMVDKNYKALLNSLHFVNWD
ncbi:hypothetical protein vseg_003949 [Gypsophila vaccaria]